MPTHSRVGGARRRRPAIGDLRVYAGACFGDAVRLVYRDRADLDGCFAGAVSGGNAGTRNVARAGSDIETPATASTTAASPLSSASDHRESEAVSSARTQQRHRSRLLLDAAVQPPPPTKIPSQSCPPLPVSPRGSG
jgi:hypothetical protein